MTPDIIDFGNGFRGIAYPAFTYMEATGDTPIRVDEGRTHLGQRVPGVAVPFPTRRHGELHKHFGICEDDDGEPLAYGLAVSLTSHQEPHGWLAAARLGQVVLYKDRRYRIEREPNDNIRLVRED